MGHVPGEALDSLTNREFTKIEDIVLGQFDRREHLAWYRRYNGTERDTTGDKETFVADVKAGHELAVKAFTTWLLRI